MNIFIVDDIATNGNSCASRSRLMATPHSKPPTASKSCKSSPAKREVKGKGSFKNQSLQLPAAQADLCECLRSLKEYFAGHPAHENATANVTAAFATQRLTANTNAIQIVSDCKRDQRQKREARGAAEVNLTKLMRRLVFELNAAMEPDDVRWLDFVDSLPADTQVPEAVSNLKVDGDGPGLLAAEWSPRARSVTRCRCWRAVATWSFA